MTEQMKSIPALRFPKFDGAWNRSRISDILDRISRPVDVVDSEMYRQLGIRSHGKGVFHKAPVSGKSLGNKRVFWVEKDAFVVNIVFAWEQAIAKTSAAEGGMIASHRFPMYQPRKGVAYLDYVHYLFLTKKGKYLLGLASPGGAGRNKTLGQKNFEELEILIPSVGEQKKIADFLTAVDDKIQQLSEKCRLLIKYKKGVMQQIFSQQIRFKNNNCQPYPDWEEKRLGCLATFTKGKGISKTDIVGNGALECIRYGELYTHYNETIDDVKSKTNCNTSNLVLSEANDVIIPASGETQLDIATASCVLRKGVALGGDLNIIRSKFDGVFLSYYLNSKKKHDIARLAQGISVIHLYSSQLKSLIVDVPCIKEQQEIASFLSEIDNKIEQVNQQLEQARTFKKGLLQQMFV